MATAPSLRILIVDDEPLARQRLEDLIEEVDGVELVGMATNGPEAVGMIQELVPDLVFLDVQMPGMTGPEVVQKVGPGQMPVTIFVTAYDQYALQAFDLAATDYLLKPFDDDRFGQALERARKLVGLRDVGAATNRLYDLLQAYRAEALPTEGMEDDSEDDLEYLERIAVEMRGQVRIVSVEDIDYITASGPYAELHVGDETHLIRERMQTLEERLDPELFFRIHRSAIVRLSQIKTLLHGAGGDYAVRLLDGTRLKVSRSRKEDLDARLGV